MSDPSAVIKWSGKSAECIGEVSVNVDNQPRSLFIIRSNDVNMDINDKKTDLKIVPSMQTSSTICKEHMDGEPTKSGKLEFKCSICPKVFYTKQHFDRHFNLHSKETLYPCTTCGKVLLDKSYLLRHLKTHSEEKCFECTLCDKKFVSASSLKRHSSTHDPSLRPHVCSECGKRFPDNSSLKKHARTHDRVKTHICIICAKGFSHVGDLNSHLKYHDIEKQFRCDVCGKEFSRNNNLVRHQAIHSRNGNFKCTVCCVSFQHAASLTKHILTKHPGDFKVKTKKLPLVDQEILKPEMDDPVSSDDDPQDLEENVPQEDSKQIPLNITSPTQQIELVRSSPSSFEIYHIDASGSLVRVTDAAISSIQPLQVSASNGQSSTEFES